MESEGEYERIELVGGAGYVRRRSVPLLKMADAAIFDCDGVLIDARRSYKATIRRTAAHILGKLSGERVLDRWIGSEVIYALARTGGFNNDWDATYVILLYATVRSPHFDPRESNTKSLSARLEKNLGTIGSPDDMSFERWIKEIVNPGIIRIAQDLDSGGRESFRRILADQGQSARERIEWAEQFLGYPGSAEASLLTNIFDEIFYGPELFRSVYGREPLLHLNGGLVEREEVMIRARTLDRLAEIIGGKRFGIASGRSAVATRFTLGGLMNYFKDEATVFIEDEERRVRDSERAGLWKPQPYSLLRSSRGLGRFKNAVYIGDSAEDIIMVHNANMVSPRYLFAGIYGTGLFKREVIRDFMSRNSDLILPTVNGLPRALEMVSQA